MKRLMILLLWILMHFAPFSPLSDAAREGNVAQMRALLGQGADPDEFSGSNGWTPLMHAIHKNQIASVTVLLDAHAKFDTRKGVKFETYAVWRIKGAVLDQLRALDWVSRSMRRKARNLDGITRKLDQKLGRAASEEEVARELKMSRDDFYRLLDHVRGAVLVSLDEAWTNDGEDQGTLADHLADPNSVDAYLNRSAARLCARLAKPLKTPGAPHRHGVAGSGLAIRAASNGSGAPTRGHRVG